jgi:hypothetical protein
MQMAKEGCDSMATPGQLVEAMADCLGISAATVTQYDRMLAENGLRSKSGRGLSAARVTAADAANLLIAIVGSPISGAAIKDAAHTCKIYGALPNFEKSAKRQKLRLLGAKKLAALPVEHSLRDGLTALIEEATVGSMRPNKEKGDYVGGLRRVIVEFSSPPPRAYITVLSHRPKRRGEMVYLHSSSKVLKRDGAVMNRDLYQTRSVSFDTISRLADTLRGTI